MITPNDIATKDFKKVAVGYSPEEVDIFLDDIYEDYEALYTQSLNAAKAVEKVEEPVKVQEPVKVAEPAPTANFAALEKVMERALALAEEAAAETKNAAKLEAEQIVAAAKLEAEQMLQSARNSLFETEQEILSLKNRYELMRTRVKLLLYAEVELLEKSELSFDKEIAE